MATSLGHAVCSSLVTVCCIFVLTMIRPLFAAPLKTNSNGVDQKTSIKFLNQLLQYLEPQKEQPEEAEIKIAVKQMPVTVGNFEDVVSEDTLVEENSASETSLQPQYPCDRYQQETNTCIYVRQLGTTLTLKVAFKSKEPNVEVRWFRHFKLLNSDHEITEEFTKARCPWNVVIGGKNTEIRISPITETDFSHNSFVATVHENGRRRRRSAGDGKIIFKIETIPINLGKIYSGEEMAIKMRGYIGLPKESVTFEWLMIDQSTSRVIDIPSNIKVSHDGSAVTIKELYRMENVLITCAMYSNRYIFVALRSFHMGKIDMRLRRSQRIRRQISSEIFDWWPRRTSSNSQEFPPSNYAPYSKKHYMRTSREVVPYDQNPPPPGLDDAVDKQYNDLLVRPPSGNDESSKDNADAEATFSVLDAKLLDEANGILAKNPEVVQGNPAMSNDFQQPHNVEYNPYYQQPGMPNQPLNEEQSMSENRHETKEYLHQNADGHPSSGVTPSIHNGLSLTFDDQESKLLSFCRRHEQCSDQGYCFLEDTETGYCRCQHGYMGNGIFCDVLQ